MPVERAATAPVSADSASDGHLSPEAPLFRLPKRPWGVLAVDVLVALCSAWVDINLRSAFTDADLHSPLPHAAYVPLAVLAAASLLFRHRAPVPVAVAVTGALLLGDGAVLTLVVAYYSLARHARLIRTVLVVGAGGLCAVLAAAALHLRQFTTHHGMSTGQETLLLVGVALTAVVLPVLLGSYPRWPRRPLWWDHRRAMLFDILVVLAFPAANPGGLLVAADEASSGLFPLPAPVVAALVVLQGAALIWRRRHPMTVAVSSTALAPLVFPFFSALPVCLYSLAKYGRARRDLFLCSVGAALMVGISVTYLQRDESAEGTAATVVFVTGFAVGVPVLLGMYAGARQTVMASLRERAERLERERDLLASQARMEERARIAREMHDVVSHRVSLIVVHAGALEVGVGDNEPAAKTAQLIGEVGRQALDELRQTIGVLRLDDAGESAPASAQPTLDAVTALVDEWRAAGMAVTVSCAGEHRSLDVRVQRTGYRLVQEALTNAHKYAGGAAVGVEIRYRPDALEIAVENGPPSAAPTTPLPSGGHGLTGLAERINVLGGRLDTGPRADGGFRVTASIPTAAA
jgi:signal transduction histidine kinase